MPLLLLLMKRLYAFFSALAIAAVAQAQTQKISMTFQFGQYEATLEQVAWPKGKQAAVSLTFDDNLPEQQTIAMPALTARSLRGSFYAITGQRPVQFIQMAHIGGHEVGSHSVSHLDLRNVGANLADELANSRTYIRAVTGDSTQGQSIAWPLGNSNPAIRTEAANYYLGARNAGINANGYEKYNYRNYFQVGAKLMAESMPDSNWSGLLARAKRDTGWFVPLYHGINTGYSFVTQAKFERQMDTLLADTANIWVAPFNQALKYVRQRNQGLLSSAGTLLKHDFVGDQNIELLEITDTLDHQVYTEPLWFKLSTNANWGPAHVIEIVLDTTGVRNSFWFSGPSIPLPGFHQGQPLEYYFSLTPDQYKAFGVAVAFYSSTRPRLNASVKTWPNPAGSGQRLTLQMEQAERGQVRILDMQGRQLLAQTVAQPQRQHEIDLPQLPAGVYTLIFEAETAQYTNKLIIQQ